MHILYSYTSINNIHIVVRKHISNCAASSLVNSTEFRELEHYLILIHYLSNLSYKFCRSITRT